MALIILPPGSDSGDLQAAIDGASFGDVIQLSGDMPFTATVTIRAMLEITIKSDDGNNWVMQQFLPNMRHFEIDGGSLILENVIVDGGNTGGGIKLIQGAFALMDGAVIQNCLADNGGGAEVVSGVFSIYGGEIRNNTAKNGGGVYMNAGMFNMSASTGEISGNKAENGGGVYVNGGTYRLTGGNVINNEAQNGGGLYVNSGTFSMNRGVFDSNKSTQDGGAIYTTSPARLAITGDEVIISNNTSGGRGGGIYTEDLAFANLEISGNVAFRCNRASVAYNPPENASTLYPNIIFTETTIMDHALNNYDINYTNGTPAKVTHNVKYNPNGGLGCHVGPNIEPCEEDTILSAEETGITRKGCVFVRWSTNPDGSGISYEPGDKLTLSNNVILYAQWDCRKKCCCCCCCCCRPPKKKPYGDFCRL